MHICTKVTVISSAATFNAAYEIYGVAYTFALPTFSTDPPSDLDLVINIGNAPTTIFTKVGSEVQIAASAKTTYKYSFWITGIDTGCYAQTLATIDLYDCRVYALTFASNPLQLEVGSVSPAFNVGPAFDARCGTYTMTSDSTLVTISGRTFTANTLTTLTQSVTFTVARNFLPDPTMNNMTGSSAVSIVVYECYLTSFTLS